MPVRMMTGSVAIVQATKHPSTYDIAQVAGVAESTIQIAYANLLTEASNLVPSWFADKREVAALPMY